MKKNFKKSIRNALALILCIVTVLLGLCSCSSEKKDGKETEADSAAVQNNAAAEENAAVGTGKEISITDSDYVNVKYVSRSSEVQTLYSGHVRPEIEVDYVKLGNAIGKEGLKRYSKNVLGSTEEEADYYVQSINEYTVKAAFKVEMKEEYECVKNGDKITLKVVPARDNVTVEEIATAMGISIQEEADITVSGLEEGLKEIDFIGDLDKYIVYSGANGDCKAEFDFSSVTEPIVIENKFYLNTISNGFEIVYQNESLGRFGYFMRDLKDEDDEKYLSNATNLTEGDVLSVKINIKTNTADKLIALGYIPAAYECEVTVPDRGEYLTSKDQLTEADVNEVKQFVTNELTAKYTDVEICSAHFATIKPGIACDANDKIRIYVVYGRNSFGSKSYYCYVINALSKNDAGEFNFKMLKESDGYQNSAANMEANLNGDFTYEKLF